MANLLQVPLAGNECLGEQMIFRGSWRHGAVFASLVSCALLAAACVAPAPVGVVPAGQPGAVGPCSFERTDLVNDQDWRHPVFVLEPTGSAAPYTGGTCDDDERPVVLLAHGYLGNIYEGYQGLIEQLVSNGYVVVFPGYTIEYSPDNQYKAVDTGFRQGVEFSKRADTSRIGFVGHSFGGGMVYWLIQQADERGWGSEAIWAVNFAPYFALMNPGDGPIDLPDHIRFTMVSYDNDYFVDTRIAIEQFAAIDTPDEAAQHVGVFSDRSQSPAIEADHIGLVSVELLPGLGTVNTDHYDHWVAFRSIDATARCAIDGRWCDTDLSYTGTWPDGTPVRPAVVRDDHSDFGPRPALAECELALLNPRPCP
ncbi:MAG: alpha/beta hydrolase family protein [Microthrixaceae bacterium]